MSVIGFLCGALYSLLHLGLDSWREPDVYLQFTEPASEIKYRLSGYRLWDFPRSFDAMGRGNGICISSFFELSEELQAYYLIWPRVKSTSHYPSSFGIVGTVRALPAGGSALSLWLRLTNLRAVFYGLFGAATISFLILLVVGSSYPLLGGYFGLGDLFLLTIIFFPFTSLAAVGLSRKVADREPSRRLVEYLAQLLPGGNK